MEPATCAISQRLRQPRQKAGRVVPTVSASCPIQSVTPSHGASPSKYERKGWNVAEVRHQYGPDVVMRAVVAVLQETPPERVHPVVGHRLEDRLFDRSASSSWLPPRTPSRRSLRVRKQLGYIGLHGDHVQRAPALFREVAALVSAACSSTWL